MLLQRRRRPTIGWSMYMADLLSKIADLLVTNLAGWSAKWSADKNDVNLADPQLADVSNGSSPPPSKRRRTPSKQEPCTE